MAKSIFSYGEKAGQLYEQDLIFKKAFDDEESWAIDRATTLRNIGSGARHTERVFSSKPKKHCSRCPFPEGCIMCDLP